MRQKIEKIVEIIDVLEEKNQSLGEKTDDSKIFSIIKDLVASLQITTKTEIEVRNN